MEKKRSIGLIIVRLIMFILSLFSFCLGLILLLSQVAFLEWYVIVAVLLILGAGLIYFIGSVFWFRVNRWVGRIIICYSIVLLSYFTLFILASMLVGFFSDDTCGWGWVQVLQIVLSPYIIFPLFFIFFFTRPSMKKQFME